MKCHVCEKPNRDKAIFCKWCGEKIATKANAPLRELTGMTKVKDRLNDLMNTCESIKKREAATGTKIRLGMDMIITGNTGTGKSELVGSIAKLLANCGIITPGKIKVVDAVDYNDFAEEWDKNIAAIKGGVLCVENAQKLVPAGISDDIYVLDKLFSSMNKWSNDPIVIISGLKTGLEEFFAANPDIAGRFEYRFDLGDFTAEEILEITERKLSSKYGLSIDSEAKAKLLRIIKNEIRKNIDEFGNGHWAAKKAEEIFSYAIKRDSSGVEATACDVRGEEFVVKSLDEIMKELDSFVGVDEIRECVLKIINKIEIDKERKGGDAKREIKDHFLFLGNPGTGKTTIARIFADILCSLEVLPLGHLVEVSRKDLVAGYVGQTAIDVERCVNRAMGGILFIDEAYSLKNGDNDQFGQEAIDTLLKLVEDNRGKLVAIAAGYTKEMNEFLSANSGMESRFNETINFRDYSAEELTEIFRRMVTKEKMVLDEQAEANIKNLFTKMFITKTKNFGNARSVRNIFENALKNQSKRLQAQRATATLTQEDFRTITREDIEGEEATKEKNLELIFKELDEFEGMDSVKEEIRKIAYKIMLDKEMMEQGIADAEITPVHIVLTGNPGTGKTSVALKLGQIFKAVGLLPTDKVVEKERKSLLSTIKNETAKLVDKACDEAMGGILFIDEAYSLMPANDGGSKDSEGVEAVESLMTRMVKDAGKFVVICAGYRTQMDEFINNANPGFRRRFSHFLHIEDYSLNQLINIFNSIISKKGNTLTDEAEKTFARLVDEMVLSKNENFGNAAEMVKLFEKIKQRRAERLSTFKSSGGTITREMFLTIEAEDIPYDPPKIPDLDEVMKELNNLTGLESVKREIREIADYIKIERLKCETSGKKFSGISDHYLFVGNPGTGKTTVARIMGNIFYALGILPSNKLIEVTRKDLVASYVGQTAPKTAQVVKRAIGGVLFIDEAYSLKSGGASDFGQEATDTILPMMLDFKGKMVFIAAGYPKEIQQWIDTNSGLESRFTKTIHFEDYNPEELAEIFLKKAAGEKLKLTPEAENKMRESFSDLYVNRSKNFANAREVNNLFDRVRKKQSSRLREELNRPGFDNSSLELILESDFE